MYVINKKWDSITNIAQCTSVYVSPEHEIKAVPTGGGAVYRGGGGKETLFLFPDPRSVQAAGPGDGGVSHDPAGAGLSDAGLL